MSTIKFENGPAVNFEGTPTQQDIEEVAKKLNLQKQSNLLETKSLTPSLPESNQYQEPNTGFTGLLKNTGGLISKILPRWTMAPEEMQPKNLATVSEGVKQMVRPAYNLLGAMPAETTKNLLSIPQDIKSTYNIGKQAYSEGGAVGGAVGLGSAILETGKLLATPITWATKVFKGTMDEAMKHLTGYSASDTASQKTLNDFSNILKLAKNNPAEFTGRLAENVLKITQEKPELVLLAANRVNNALSNYTGKDIDVIHSAVAPLEKPFENALISIQQNSIKNLENDYEKWFGETKQGIKILNKANQRTEALNANGTEGETSQRILAEDRIIPETGNRKFRTIEQAQEYRESFDFLKEASRKALEEIKYQIPKIDINDWESSTIDNIRTLNKTVGDKADMIRNTMNEFDLMRDKYPDGIDIAQLDNDKSLYWQKTKFNSLKPLQGDTNYQIGNAAKDIIQNRASEAGFTDVADLNRLIGDKMEAAKMLESLDGQILKYGKIGKYFFASIGSSLGDTTIGKLIGAIGGNALANILANANVSDPIKRLILNSIQDQSPEAYTDTLNWINQQEILRQNRLQLPAGQPYGSPENPIIGQEYKGTEIVPYTDIEKENIVKYGSPEKPGGLFEYQQNIQKAKQAAGIFNHKNPIENPPYPKYFK